MSCYVVDKKVIDLMVSWIFDHNDYNDFEEIDNYFVFDGYRMVSADKISDLLDWLIYNYDRAFYRWVYNVAFPEFSVTNDEKSFYNQLSVKGE